MLIQRRLVGSNLLRRFFNTTATIVEPSGVVVNEARSSVDSAEIGRFTVLANEWLDENGPMKILHAFNRVRIPWIVDELKKVCLFSFIYF